MVFRPFKWCVQNNKYGQDVRGTDDQNFQLVLHNSISIVNNHSEGLSTIRKIFRIQSRNVILPSNADLLLTIHIR